MSGHCSARIPSAPASAGTVTVGGVPATVETSEDTMSEDQRRIVIDQREILSFTVHDTGAMRGGWGGLWIGAIRPKLAWQSQLVAPANGHSQGVLV